MRPGQFSPTLIPLPLPLRVPRSQFRVHMSLARFLSAQQGTYAGWASGGAGVRSYNVTPTRRM